VQGQIIPFVIGMRVSGEAAHLANKRVCVAAAEREPAAPRAEQNRAATGRFFHGQKGQVIAILWAENYK
jgi:hypothetical protein